MVLRVGYDAKRAFCNRTGLGNYSRTLISNIMRFHPDIKISLYTPEKRFSFLEEEIQNKTVELFEPKVFFQKQFSSLWRSFSLPSLLQKQHVYHGLSHELPFGLNRQSLCKTVVTIHDLIYIRYPEFFPFVDRFIYDAKFRYACERASKIVAICEQTARDLEEFFGINPDRIEVIYQSIHESFYQSCSDFFKNQIRIKYHLPQSFIFFAGTLQERKNPKAILKALWILKNRLKAPLVLAGKEEPGYKKELLSLVSQYGLASDVFFLGPVSLEELRGLYQMGDIFVFPSFFEGFGLPIVEALASGCPVITSKGSCFPEAAGSGAIYIDPKEPEELASAIECLLLDRSLQKQLVKNGQDHISKFEREKTAQNMVNLYKFLL